MSVKIQFGRGYLSIDKRDVAIRIDQSIIPVGPEPKRFRKNPIPFFRILPFDIVDSRDYDIGIFDCPVRISEKDQIGIGIGKCWA